VMTEAAHLLIVVARKNVGEVADTETHLSSECGRQQLARDFGRIDRRGRVQAIVAIAAMLGRVLTEMAKQDRPAAAGSLDKGRERVQPLALRGPALRLNLLLDSLPRQREILGGPEQPRFRRFSVAAGATGLL